MSKNKKILVGVIVLLLFVLVGIGVYFMVRCNGKSYNDYSVEEESIEGEVAIEFTEDGSYFVNNNDFVNSMNAEHLTIFKECIPTDMVTQFDELMFISVEADGTVYATYMFEGNQYSIMYYIDEFNTYVYTTL